MNNTFPLVSIIMPVYNKNHYLKNSIESILNQTYQNIELILIDDKSTDNSLDIIQNYKNNNKVKIILNKTNLGFYKSLNIGIQNSSGSIIGVQGADDYSLSTRIEKQVSLLIKKKLLIIGSNMIRSHLSDINYLNDNDIINGLKKTKHIDNKYNTDCCKEMFGFATLLIDRKLFDKYGFYIEKFKGMDMEFVERILFYECNILFDGKSTSWDFCNSQHNNIYYKINQLLYISPEMNNDNITNNIITDDFLSKRLWRLQYK